MSTRFQSKGEKDLFEQFQTADKEIRKKTRLLLPDIKKSFILSYENVIFLAIGFIMACVICFTLGVERGKGMAPRQRRSEAAGAVEKTVSIENLAASQKIETAQKIQKDGYVIQLAAFKKRDSAEQGRSELRKNGFTADIKQSGDYYQLYIGGFESKKEAQGLLDRLKNTYKDCYIKKY